MEGTPVATGSTAGHQGGPDLVNGEKNEKEVMIENRCGSRSNGKKGAHGRWM